MATTPSPVSLAHHFATLDNPRIEWSRRHELIDIIGIVLCAVISGAESWPTIERYGHAKRDWLEKHFRLTNGIPSHDTFRRVFCLLERGAFPRRFADWVAALADSGVGTRRAIPIDGKTARRSGRRGVGLTPLHRVSVWAGANHVTLGQVAVDEKPNCLVRISSRPSVIGLRHSALFVSWVFCPDRLEDCSRWFVGLENHDV